MTKTNKTTNKATINTSIIDICYNGLTAIECETYAIKKGEEYDKAYFNSALAFYFLNGKTIPQYVDTQGNLHGSATIDSAQKKSLQDIAEAVDRHKGTISKMVKAMESIIDEGYFEEFYTNKLKFSFDKINLIFDDKYKDLLESHTLSSLLSQSFKSLKPQLDALNAKKSGEKSEDKKTEESKEENKEVVITYEGKNYTLKLGKDAFEKWLAENLKAGKKK